MVNIQNLPWYIAKNGNVYVCVHLLAQTFPHGSVIKNHLPKQEMQKTQVQSLDWKDPLEEEMALHSSILA